MSKSAKRRFCPAVQREITSAECGENRISHYACPMECAFNPFAPANYDAFSEIEAGVIHKSMDWFLATTPNRVEAEREINKLAGRPPAERHAYQVVEIFCKRDANGLTLAQRWEAAGFPGLKNDERVVQRSAMQMRLRVIEVHRVWDDLRTEAVDLLDPEAKPFLICDRGLAALACRFSTLLGWFHPLPHFWRCSGFALHLQPFAGFDALEIITEIVRHLGGPEQSSEWMNWFGGHFARFTKALEAVRLARQEQMFAGLDAEFGKAVYELRAPFAECRAVLDAVTAAQPDALADGERDEGFAEARVWFETTGNEAPSDSAHLVLGRVLLGQAHWRVEAIGAERLARLRQAVEDALGSRVRFTGERRDNLLAHVQSKQLRHDPDLVPPRLLENPTLISVTSSRVPTAPQAGARATILAHYLEEQDRAWLDDPVPALDGKTPRAAANDPGLRLKLIRLLKDRVRSVDEQNLETGGTRDLNWLLRELGVPELIFDPPPARPPTRSYPDEAAEDEFEDRGPTDGLAPWPPLPPGPFTHEEALERLNRSVQNFPIMDEALDAMKDAGCYLIEDVPDVLGHLLSKEECVFLIPVLIHVWFAFVPPGCYGPDLEPEDMHEAFRRQLQRLEGVAEMQKSTVESGRFLLEDGPQPAVMELLGDQLLSQWESVPRAQRPKRGNLPLLMVVLKTVVELLDARCRKPEAGGDPEASSLDR